MRQHNLKSEDHPLCDLSKRSSRRKVARISLSILEAHEVHQEADIPAHQDTQEAITAHEVQQELYIPAQQETQEAITAHKVCTLSSVAVFVSTQNFILSRKLAQTQLKSNSRKMDHHLPITATVIQTIHASRQDNLIPENLFYGLIQTMVDTQESGEALSMSIHDQPSREPPQKSRCIIRNRISSTSDEGIESDEAATAVADVDRATK